MGKYLIVVVARVPGYSATRLKVSMLSFRVSRNRVSRESWFCASQLTFGSIIHLLADSVLLLLLLSVLDLTPYWNAPVASSRMFSP